MKSFNGGYITDPPGRNKVYLLANAVTRQQLYTGLIDPHPVGRLCGGIYQIAASGLLGPDLAPLFPVARNTVRRSTVAK